MNIIPLSAFQDNYIWLIINEPNKSFICIDPGDAVPVLDYARKNALTLSAIFITHHHADHSAGIVKLIDYFPLTKVFGPEDIRIFGLSRHVRDKEIIQIDDLSFQIIAIPGHTSSHIGYLEPKQEWLFSGDTLFSAGCGRVFDGTIEELHHSIALLKALPDDTKIFCGHEYTIQNLKFAGSVEPLNNTIKDYLNYLLQHKSKCSLPSTIALEKQINPFMRTEEPSVIDYAIRHGIKNTESLNVFTLLREQKNKYQVS